MKDTHTPAAALEDRGPIEAAPAGGDLYHLGLRITACEALYWRNVETFDELRTRTPAALAAVKASFETCRSLRREQRKLRAEMRATCGQAAADRLQRAEGPADEEPPEWITTGRIMLNALQKFADEAQLQQQRPQRNNRNLYRVAEARIERANAEIAGGELRRTELRREVRETQEMLGRCADYRATTNEPTDR